MKSKFIKPGIFVSGIILVFLFIFYFEANPILLTEPNHAHLERDARVATISFEYDEAIELYEKIIEKRVSPETEIETYLILANLYFEARQNEKIRGIVDKGLDLAKETGKGQDLVYYLYNISQLGAWEDWDERDAFFEKAKPYKNLRRKITRGWDQENWATDNHDPMISYTGTGITFHKDFSGFNNIDAKMFDINSHDAIADFNFLSEEHKCLFFEEYDLRDTESREKELCPNFEKDASNEDYNFVAAGYLNISISEFKRLEASNLGKMMKTRRQELFPESKILREIGNFQKSRYFTLKQGIYFLSIERKVENDYGSTVKEEIWIAQKGEMLISLNLRYYTIVEQEIMRQFEFFLEESDLELNDHFQSILEIRNSGLEVCASKEVSESAGACVKPNYDPFIW